MASDLKEYSVLLLDLLKNNESIVVVTLTNIRGSAPQNLGARMIVGRSGLIFGTVGGGKVEAHCLKLASEYLNDSSLNHNYSFTWNLQRDIGMTCGGEVSFLFEVHKKESIWNIAVFGAGHISIELCKVLSNLNCQVKVIDNRAEWLARIINHPRIEKIQTDVMKDEVLKLDDGCFVALMTMGHACDVPILFESLKKEKQFPYLGVIGSIAKRARMEQELLTMGLNQTQVKSFICPLGEDIGSNEPSEIAISIAAQLLKHRDMALTSN